jgi:hypothetical protein
VKILAYLTRVGSASSQLANVIFLGGTPNESISGRSYRRQWWIRRPIDAVLGRNHCKNSYVQDAVDAVDYLYEYSYHDAV